MSMKTRPLGRTGLMVSLLTLGTMEFGTKVDDDQANDLFDAALDSASLGPRTPAQFTAQLAALDVELDETMLDDIDRIVPPGSGTVPYYLDDSFVDFRPHPCRW